jgi:nucleoside-triphosphatase THEP1
MRSDNHPSEDSHGVRAAAILDDGTIDVDALLAEVAASQRQAGRQVCGLLMTHPDGQAGCAAAMVLVDIQSRDEYLVSQALGSGSAACRADTEGFARASHVLRDALAARPDLVISNRFGGLEAEGGGFASELLELMAHGIPVLTAVAERHRPGWELFTGGAVVLPARAAAIADWVDRTLAATTGA